MKKNTTKKWQSVLFALGIALCLTGAFLMAHGSIFGDRTAGIAIVTGIIGIGLISTFTTAPRLKDFKPQTKTANANNAGR